MKRQVRKVGVNTAKEKFKKINGIQYKLCNGCGEYCEINDFFKRKESGGKGDRFNRRPRCKNCELKICRDKSRTKNGLASRIIRHQRSRSVERGHNPPEYNLAELRDWLFSQKNFHLLYENWVNSGYDRLKTPSCDRIDNSKGYSFSNIKLMTFYENQTNASIDRINGTDGVAKKVGMYNEDMVLLNTYPSATNAAKSNKFCQTVISQACLNGYKRYGFFWKYI